MPQEESMRVVVRMRPPSEQEGEEAINRPIVDKAGRKISIVRDRKGTAEFSFSSVLDDTSTQAHLYDMCKDTINDVMDGINCCILTYGQTGSGKTYSMLGRGLEDPNFVESGDSGPQSPGMMNDAEYGIVPRSVTDVFAMIDSQKNSESFDFLINCQFLQIYNEKIYDLLQDRKRENALQLRDAERGASSSVYVQGLSEYRVHSADDVLGLMAKGLRNRAIRSTELNNESSRSHTILQLFLQLQGVDSSGLATLKRSVFSFVDLAGSEKWRPSLSHSQSISGGLVTQQQAVAEQQLREMTNINTSLHVLGNCVSALIEPGRKHIPFRDSLLTRLLQDSLGGGRTILVATVRSDEGMIDETYSTLQFASRASKIKTVLRPSSKVVLGSSNAGDGLTLEKARKEIALLRSQVQSLQVEAAAGRSLASTVVAKRNVSAEEGGGNIEACPTCEQLRLALVQCQQQIRELQLLVAEDIDREEDCEKERRDGRHIIQDSGHEDDEATEDFDSGSNGTLDENDEDNVDDDSFSNGQLYLHPPSPRASHEKRHAQHARTPSSVDRSLGSSMGSKMKKGQGSARKGQTPGQGHINPITHTPIHKQKPPKKKSSAGVDTKQTGSRPVPQDGVSSKKKKSKGSRALSAGQVQQSPSNKRALPALKSNSADSSPAHNHAYHTEAIQQGRKKTDGGRVGVADSAGEHSVERERVRISNILSMSRAAATAADSTLALRQSVSTPVLVTPRARAREEGVSSSTCTEDPPDGDKYVSYRVIETDTQQFQPTQQHQYSRAQHLQQYDSAHSYDTLSRTSQVQAMGVSSEHSRDVFGPQHSRTQQPIQQIQSQQSSPQKHFQSHFNLDLDTSGIQEHKTGVGIGSPSSVRSTSSLLTIATAPTGACRKHGLEACVLCAMFGGPVAVAASSHTPSVSTHQSQYVVSNHIAPSRYVSGPNPGVSHVQEVVNSVQASGLCSAHFVMDCLLCSITGASVPMKAEQKTYTGQNMYTSPMLGAGGSVASSISSLSSADSAFGFSSIKDPTNTIVYQQQPVTYQGYNPSINGETQPYSSQTGQYRNDASMRKSEYTQQAPLVQAKVSTRDENPSGDAYRIGRGGVGTEVYSPPKSVLSHISSVKAKGIVYEDEADMVDTQSQHQQLLGSVSSTRRDHRRVPFNRERYGDIGNGSSSIVQSGDGQRNAECGQSGESGFKDYVSSPVSKHSGGSGETRDRSSSQPHVTNMSKKKSITRKLPNGATIMSSGGKKITHR